MTKGILLAGGYGTRLFPTTVTTSKQLLHIYDKPMIYYPLATLMMAGIREILLITNGQHLDSYKALLGSGNHLGLEIKYSIQDFPGGVAEALVIGEQFIGDDRVCLALGDNILFGTKMGELLRDASDTVHGACMFAVPSSTPSQFGVVAISNGEVVSIEEKPISPKSNLVVPGLYFYNPVAVEVAKNISASDRGEREITAVNQIFLQRKDLKVMELSRAYTWLDVGTSEAILEASLLLKAFEERSGYKVAAIEEVALNYGLISMGEYQRVVESMVKSPYREYLEKRIDRGHLYE